MTRPRIYVVRPLLALLAVICPIIATTVVLNFLNGKYDNRRMTLAQLIERETKGTR